MGRQGLLLFHAPAHSRSAQVEEDRGLKALAWPCAGHAKADDKFTQDASGRMEARRKTWLTVPWPPPRLARHPCPTTPTALRRRYTQPPLGERPVSLVRAVAVQCLRLSPIAHSTPCAPTASCSAWPAVAFLHHRNLSWR